MFVASVAALVIMQGSSLLQGADFPDFYCAARMLLDGHGHRLYDADLQRHYQALYSARIGTLYIHPPFEAVLYLAVVWLPLRQAYWLWSIFNVVILGSATQKIAIAALPDWDWKVIYAASLTFVPVLLCVLQGQDSILLLLLLALAFIELKRGRALYAGCLLALGLFKFQMIAPLVLILVLAPSRVSRSELAKGFSLVLLALVASSIAICGWSILLVYPRFLTHLPEQRFAGIIPTAMANFRGLAYTFFPRSGLAWTITVVAILSTAALIKTLLTWKDIQRSAHSNSVSNHTTEIKNQFDLAFACTVSFSVLVSYHLNPHDLSVLLLAFALALHPTLSQKTALSRRGNLIVLTLIALLFLPPLHLWAIRAHLYSLVALPVIALFLLSCPDSTRSRS